MLSNSNPICLKKTAIAAMVAFSVIGVGYGAPHYALSPLDYKPVTTPFLSVNAMLKNGVMATSGGEKELVFLRISGDARAPNGQQLSLDGCWLTGQASGDLVTSRVKISTNKISCYSKSLGKYVTGYAYGWVVGSDGTNGISGSIVSGKTKYKPLANVSGMPSLLTSYALAYLKHKSYSTKEVTAFYTGYIDQILHYKKYSVLVHAGEKVRVFMPGGVHFEGDDAGAFSLKGVR